MSQLRFSAWPVWRCNPRGRTARASVRKRIAINDRMVNVSDGAERRPPYAPAVCASPLGLAFAVSA